MQTFATDHDPDGSAETIARAFVEARRAGTALPDYPGAIPSDLTSAYAIQDAALALDGRVVAGWKVGRINPPQDGVDRLTGPIFADQVVTADPGQVVAMPVFADGFAAAEAEYLLRLGDGFDPHQSRFTMEDAIAAVDTVHVGIEIASSPFPRINELGPTVTISDYGNNNGLVIGPEITGWRDTDINDWPVALHVNDAPIGSARAATMLDGPFGAVRFLLNHAAARGRPLAAGTWVPTGAVTGVHRVAVGDCVEARFGDQLTTYCSIIAR
ncbi:fumarylacetoacetate hydrolase family protein [uncultured Sphingomonas sp.]|uniref:2-keto-4-pentenoate hydratase n=1 Tax=uncultured Sphingomonas sp. TaxID=158754 RepID=UPI0025D605D0|nr:fumarylacetoacetate hydrolase family protein [uncultured Sphingomonas sp.]